MAAQQKVTNACEEFKRFEEEVVEGHRKRMLEELRAKLEEMGRRAS